MRPGKFMLRMFMFTFMLALGSRGVSCRRRQAFLEENKMDWMHAMLPEEEVYQMLLLFVVGACVGGVLKLARFAMVERRQA
jgi:hypothetical protein